MTDSPLTLPGSSTASELNRPTTAGSSPLPEAQLRQQLNPKKNLSSRSRRPWKFLLVVLLLLGVVTGGALARDQWMPYAQPLLTQAGEYVPFLNKKAPKLSGVVTESVRRGPFRITVTERGTLDSLRNAVLASKVEGSTTIISIIPEGSQVKQGDLVCELDSSSLVEKETQQQISVTQANSNLQSAKEAVEIQKTQNDSDIAAAMLKLELAELDLKKFVEGDLKQQENELASQVTLAKEKVAQAEETYEFTMRLVKKGYKTQTELESARITLQTESINRDIALGKLSLLKNYDSERTRTELQANAKEFARELDRVKRKAAAALTQAEADLAAKTLTYEVETSKHNRLKEQIALCKIYATQDGQVIYANNRDGRSDQVLVEEGATVRERQPLVNLPDLSEMKVNVRIHESRISLIRAGLNATVKVDAFGGKTFPGRVESVSSVPSSTGNFMSRDLKEYEAVVRLLGDASEVSQLRPGLTAEIEVLVSSRENVLQAPIQSISTKVGQQFAFVIRGDKAMLRKVTIGESNDRMIEILGGLEEGELVAMNPASKFQNEIKELETELIAEQAKRAAEDAKNPPPAVPASPPAQGLPSFGGENASLAGARPGEGRGIGGNREGGRNVPGIGGPAVEGTGNGRPPAGSEGAPRSGNPLAFFDRMDVDGDGKLVSSELLGPVKDQMATLDKDQDGAISREEFQSGFVGRPRGVAPLNGPSPEQAGGG